MTNILVLLPGMDGTGRLFAPLMASLPPEQQTVTLSYPRDEMLGYGELVALVRRRLPDEPYVLLAESFSGPIGVMLAVERPPLLRGLVLCATFLRNPLPRWLRWLRWFVSPTLLRRPPPLTVVRRFLLGEDAPNELVEATRSAASSVRPSVLCARIKEVLTVDVSAQLAEVPVPLVYLSARDDNLVGQRGAAQMAAARPGIPIKTLDGPHLLLQANPTEAAGAIMDICR